MDNTNSEFFAIADSLVSEEANDYLDSRLDLVDKWVATREAAGLPADLRTLVEQVMHEPNQRGPVIVAMCTALWRLREIKEQANADK